MRRRITLAIVGSVAVALLLAGLGTLLITRFEARSNAQAGLVADAQSLVGVLEQQLTAEAEIARLRAQIGGAPPADDGTRPKQPAAPLRELGQRFHLHDVALLVLGPRQLRGAPPKGMKLSELSSPANVTALQAGRTVSGRHGSLAWAAASTSLPGPGGRRLVVALTRNLRYQWGDLGYFLIAGGAVLLLAVLLSFRLSRRIIKPLREANDAAHHLAAGELSTRVPEPAATANDELATLSRSINHLAENLERSRGLERQFLLSVSHDLRTPLTSIRGFAEAITDGTAPDAERAAGVILSESRRLERLVRDLLDLAKLDAQEFSLHPVTVDVGELAAQSAEGFRHGAGAAGVSLAVSSPPEVCWAVADPDRLAQVVANLVENALKFAAGRVAVRCSPDLSTASVQIQVTDDGPGIAPEDLPHVFERLYVARAQPRAREAGSGLGLAIARELVTAMGGSLAAHPGNPGTAMLVTLPASPAPAAPASAHR